MWGHVDELLARARRLDGLAGADLAAVLRALLGEVPAHLRDPGGQGGAGGVAVAGGPDPVLARRRGAPHEDPAYSFAAIDHLAGRLEADDAAWRAWFGAAGADPIVVPYDDLEADPAGTAGAVLGALGLDDRQVVVPGLRRQADERSAQWAAHYRDERRSA